MPIPIISAIPIIGKAVDSIFGIIDKSIKDKDQAAQLKHDISISMSQMEHDEVTKLIEARSAIIQAEATGESWLQRNWRPILMLIIIIIIANNYIIFPYLSLFTTKVVVLELPDKMWALLTVGVGGYVVGRTSEKMMTKFKEKN